MPKCAGYVAGHALHRTWFDSISSGSALPQPGQMTICAYSCGIRIIHVTTSGRTGGAERLIADLVVAAQAERLHDVSVVMLSEPGDLGRVLSARGIRFTSIPLRGIRDLPATVVALARYLRIERPEIVHAHLLHGSVIGLLAGRLAQTPLRVMTRHYERYVWMYGSAMDRLLHTVGHALADHIFAISHAAQQVMLEREGIRPDRVTVVHNGIDVARVRGSAPPVHPRSGIVSVGSLEARKGHEHLVRAFAMLDRASAPDLTIVGTGPLRTQLEALVEELGVAKRAHLAGYDPNPYPTLAKASLYVQPSMEEGFGIAVLEAMALGTPVVATTAGGLPEIITDGVDGLLVPSGDAAALRDAMARLLEDSPLRGRIAVAAAARVEGTFSASAAARRYADAYVRLMAQRTR